MDALTRRRFIRASGVVGAGALAAGAAGVTMAELLRSRHEVEAHWLARPLNRVVLVTLYGGNDGLNTVIPYTDAAYHSLRSGVAYAPGEVIQLDHSLGLNPALRGLKQVWDSRRLAVLLGVGYPKPNRSHFRSMDIWQTGAPSKVINTGWVGRWLDGTKAPRQAAVSMEPVLPPVLAGTTRTGCCVAYGGIALPRWSTEAMVSSLGGDQPDEPDMCAWAAGSYRDLVAFQHLLGPRTGSTVQPTGTGGQSSLSIQLGQVLRCIEAGVPAQVFSVSMGGFDSHADERDAHQSLLGQLDQALTGFVDALDRIEAGRQVSVLVYSEFGRRVRANASQGTDHGTAGPVLVLGPRVAGGFYGEQPSLTDLDDGDLKATMDFRDILGTVLATVLDAEPERYLEGYRPRRLPLFHH